MRNNPTRNRTYEMDHSCGVSSSMGLWPTQEMQVRKEIEGIDFGNHKISLLEQ
jgi:hypothetical protein